MYLDDPWMTLPDFQVLEGGVKGPVIPVCCQLHLSCELGLPLQKQSLFYLKPLKSNPIKIPV